MYERPELCFGSYEYIATADYCKVNFIQAKDLVSNYILYAATTGYGILQ